MTTSACPSSTTSSGPRMRKSISHLRDRSRSGERTEHPQFPIGRQRLLDELLPPLLVPPGEQHAPVVLLRVRQPRTCTHPLVHRERVFEVALSYVETLQHRGQ